MRELETVLTALDPRCHWDETLSYLAGLQIYHDVTLAFTSKPLALADAARAQQLVLRAIATPAVSAVNVYKQATLSSVSSTGIPPLNELLSGGWPVGQLSQVAGTRAAGKTLLALCSTFQFLIDHPDWEAEWIDTEASFSPDRAFSTIKSMLAARMPGQNGKVADADILLVLDRLHVSTALDVASVMNALHRMMKKHQAEADPKRPAQTFIVLDSIARLFKDKLASPSAQASASMVTLLRFLRSVAQNPHAPAAVILINESASSLPSNPQSAFANLKIRPALGKTFASMMDTTLVISKADDLLLADQAAARDQVVAELFKSRDQVSGHWCLFNSNGVRMFEEVQRQSTTGNQYQANMEAFAA